MQMLDKVKIKWPPPGMSPQMAMVGGMTMSAPQQEVSLGQVLIMAKTKAGTARRAEEKTEEVAKRIKELESKILRLEAGTPEHKAARWELNQLEGGPWSYDHWSKVYEANILKAKKSNAGVAEYQKALGWGKVEVTVDAGGSPRRLDIADIKTQKAVEIKEYQSGYISHAADIASEVERDAILVSEGWDITWVLIKTKASEPLLDALKAAGIKVKYE